MGEPTIVLQISDTHVGADWHGRDPLAALEATVGAAAAIGVAPDAVLLSGDLTDDGGEAEFAAVASLVGRLGAPLHVLPGNHDDRAAMRRAFELPGTGDEPLLYAVDVGPLRLVVLDGTRPGAESGSLDGGRLQWVVRGGAPPP